MWHQQLQRLHPMLLIAQCWAIFRMAHIAKSLESDGIRNRVNCLETMSCVRDVGQFLLLGAGRRQQSSLCFTEWCTMHMEICLCSLSPTAGFVAVPSSTQHPWLWWLLSASPTKQLFSSELLEWCLEPINYSFVCFFPLTKNPNQPHQPAVQGILSAACL